MGIKSIEEVLDVCRQYDHIISDIWGVVHDGVHVFEEALYLFDELIKEEKTVVLLSNSPLRNTEVAKKLNKMGFGSKNYHAIYTSGDLLYDDMQNGFYEQPVFAKPFGFIGEEKKFFLDACLCEYTDDYFLGQTLFILSLSKLSNNELIALNKHVISNHITVVCGNGDICVFSQGERVLRPGFLARLYKTQGVHTVIYGKPDTRIYEKCHELIQYAPKEKILMIGDMYETDILGAVQFGIDALQVGELCQSHYPEASTKIFAFKDFGVAGTEG